MARTAPIARAAPGESAGYDMDLAGSDMDSTATRSTSKTATTSTGVQQK